MSFFVKTRVKSPELGKKEKALSPSSPKGASYPLEGVEHEGPKRLEGGETMKARGNGNLARPDPTHE